MLSVAIKLVTLLAALSSLNALAIKYPNSLRSRYNVCQYQPWLPQCQMKNVAPGVPVDDASTSQVHDGVKSVRHPDL